MTPTRRQKRTWRRRVYRAKHTCNRLRAVFDKSPGYPIHIGVFDDPATMWPRRILAHWSREQ